MVIELSSILEPDDFGPWFSRGHANEHNFVAQYVLVIEMRGLCYAGTLRKKKEEPDNRYPFIKENRQHILKNVAIWVVKFPRKGYKII